MMNFKTTLGHIAQNKKNIHWCCGIYFLYAESSHEPSQFWYAAVIHAPMWVWVPCVSTFCLVTFAVASLGLTQTNPRLVVCYSWLDTNRCLLCVWISIRYNMSFPNDRDNLICRPKQNFSLKHKLISHLCSFWLGVSWNSFRSFQ